MYVIVGTFYQYLPYLKKKKINRKNMQYESIILFSFFSFFVKHKIWFSKVFLQKEIWKKWGSSYN